jgi:hypothetical protein
MMRSRRECSGSTQALQLLFLQHPQQFHLLGQWHAFDFIEKQRAAVGVFQLADALAGRR